MFDFLKNRKGEILNIMFLDPEKKFYLAEIAKQMKRESSAYQKYVESFIKEGVFCEERIGNMRFFWLNKEHQFYEEIKGMISKSIGVEAQLKTILANINSVGVAFIFGSFASDKLTSFSDIDLFIIGEEKDDEIIKKFLK